MLEQVLADLDSESAVLRGRVAGLDTASWASPTPARGWTVAHQIAHLTWTDEAAALAASAAAGDPDAARRWDALLAAADGLREGFVDARAGELAALPPADLLARWDGSRAAVAGALRRVGSAKIQWLGPPMKATSMATARFMETWAHGLDAAAARHQVPERTDRIRHVCHLGVVTRRFAYGLRGRPAPTTDVLVDLVAPSGVRWTWGDPSAEQRISGPAWDFARVAVRRMHPADSDLVAVGADAREWLGLVQAFAGPPGDEPPRLRAAER